MGRRGFSLVEAVVVAAILFGLFGGIALVLASTGRNVWVRTGDRLAIMMEAQRALNRLSEELRAGRQTNLTCTPGRVAFDPLVGKRILYEQDPLNGNQLIREQEEVRQLITASLANTGPAAPFVATCQANGLVRIALTIQHGTSRRTLTSQVWVRNPPEA